MINGLGERLKKLREKFGYSQRTIAKRLKISPSVISGYESGEKSPSLEVLIAISDIYNCSTDYLLGKKMENQSVILDTRGLNDEEIKAIVALIDVMKNKTS